MKTIEKTMLTVVAKINAPVEKVWSRWTDPKHIIHWNNASDDWHTPSAQNDLRIGGKFLYRMESKDGSQGFDFSGKYKKVVLNKQLFYTLDDGREVKILFISDRNETTVKETFEAEQENTIELQRIGWQAILNNFKEYTETPDKRQNMHFEINILASAEKIYTTLLGNKTYSEWTSVFNPTSHFEGSWGKGSELLFLGTDKDGATGGMKCRIRENIVNKFVSIEYIGIIRAGKEILSGSEFDTWAGALENYTLTEENGSTIFSVDLEAKHEIGKEFRSYFSVTWPKALKKLKEICETT